MLQGGQVNSTCTGSTYKDEDRRMASDAESSPWLRMRALSSAERGGALQRLPKAGCTRRPRARRHGRMGAFFAKAGKGRSVGRAGHGERENGQGGGSIWGAPGKHARHRKPVGNPCREGQWPERHGAPTLALRAGSPAGLAFLAKWNGQRNLESESTSREVGAAAAASAAFCCRQLVIGTPLSAVSLASGENRVVDAT